MMYQNGTMFECVRTTQTIDIATGKPAELLVELYEEFADAIKEPLSATNDTENKIEELLVDFNKETLWMTYTNKFYIVKIEIFNISVKKKGSN